MSIATSKRTPGSSREVRAGDAADTTELKAAVAYADPALLLMSLVQMTGNRSLLRKYAHAFHPREIRTAYSVHDVDAVAAEEIRQLAIRELSRDRGPLDNSVLPVPDPALFQEMATLCTGGEVGAEFVPILVQQSGFIADDRVLAPTTTPPIDFSVIVVGAGMVGLNAGVKLGLSGFNYTIFEEHDDLGGTWAINTYPGAAVDTPSQYYSFSFELNADWPHYYPAGPNYLKYLEDVADKYGVRERIQFRTRVLGCRWDDDEQFWVVSTSCNGAVAEHRANVVITALGALNSPNKPDFPGRETFGGAVMHTAEWNDSVELEGKNVVVLGTGCTSVQVVTAIAPETERLTVVQRQPHWVAPDMRVPEPVPVEERWALANIPYFNQWTRLRAYWFVSDNNYHRARIDPEWAATHVSTSEENDKLLQLCVNYLERHFPDRPALKAKLTPDFPPYAKRIVKDPGFFESLKQPHVDLETGSIDRFTETGVVLTSGTEIDCDVVILATGFNVEYLTQLDVIGRGGTSLAETWGDDPKAYFGITVPGFPNLFVTSGPNTAPNHGGGHNLTSEEQVHYILECLQHMVEDDIAAMEPTAEATATYSARVDEEMDKTVWQHGGTAHGYYRNSAGKARVSCPWRMVDYWTMLREPDLKKFVLHKQG